MVTGGVSIFVWVLINAMWLHVVIKMGAYIQGGAYYSDFNVTLCTQIGDPLLSMKNESVHLGIGQCMF